MRLNKNKSNTQFKKRSKVNLDLRSILREILYPSKIGIILTIVSILLFWFIGMSRMSPSFTGPSIFYNMAIFLFPLALLEKVIDFSNIPFIFLFLSSVLLFYISIKLIIYFWKLTFHKNKLYFMLFLIFLFFLFGIDEPVVNSLYNKPDYSCNIDSDCTLKHINGYTSGCSPGTCVNKDWEHYYAPVRSVYAFCARVESNCTCENNECVTNERVID